MVENDKKTQSPTNNGLSTNRNGNGDRGLATQRTQQQLLGLSEHAQVDFGALIERVSDQTVEMMKDMNASAKDVGIETHMTERITLTIEED